MGKRFIGRYLAALDGLKQLGILRSDRLLQRDYAESVAAQVLGPKLAASTVKKAIDAHDN